jgi:hypothetical protein
VVSVTLFAVVVVGRPVDESNPYVAVGSAVPPLAAGLAAIASDVLRPAVS